MNAVKFGRWILKYCEEKKDAGIIYWSYNNKDYDTEELYITFLEEHPELKPKIKPNYCMNCGKTLL